MTEGNNDGQPPQVAFVESGMGRAFASLRSPSERLVERFRQRAEQAPILRQRPSRSWACVFGISSGPDTAGINEVLYGPVIGVSNRF